MRKDVENGMESFDPISVHSKYYKIIENKKLDDIVESNTNLKLDCSKSINWHNKMFQLVYSGGKDSIVDLEGDSFTPNLVITNSYDGSSKFGLEYGLFRMICSNMVVLPITATHKQSKHYQGNWDDNMEKEIVTMIKNFENNTENIVTMISAVKEEEPVLDMKFLYKHSTYKQLIVYLAAALKYSPEIKLTNSIFAKNDSKLETEDDIITLVQENWKSVKESHIEDLIIEARMIKYNEEVKTKWDIYNMILKLSHLVIKQKMGRYTFSRSLGQKMLINKL